MDGPTAAQRHPLDFLSGHAVDRSVHHRRPWKCHLCLAFGVGVLGCCPQPLLQPHPHVELPPGTPRHLSQHFSLLRGFGHLLWLIHLLLTLPYIGLPDPSCSGVPVPPLPFLFCICFQIHALLPSPGSTLTSLNLFFFRK